jgi:para-nitrobenzyl esterase
MMRSMLNIWGVRLLAVGVAVGGFAAAPAIPVKAAADFGTLVQTKSGKVQGISESDVVVFKGIPFAKPPVGALRWLQPQPVPPWHGVIDASEFRADCVQPLAAAPASVATSEDCLYLNIWRPASATEKPLPVMVWIYGGGLVQGGASLYPGDCLARRNLVFVSFNYRLGRFGFFAHPALARETPAAPRGNYGYMDQIAALQWVQRNIAAFGGDPSNVTIAGESAGGGSVLVMLTSPTARGLFHRAILQSPGIPTARAGVMPLRDLADAESLAVNYARTLGITGDDQAALASLRAIPATTLNEGVEWYQSPVMDGRLVAEAPERVLHAGRQAKVPVIVGANDLDMADGQANSKDELFAAFGPLALQARTLYDPEGDASLAALNQSVLADRTMVEPSRHLAELTTMAGQPAYLYRFSYVPDVRRTEIPGATHASEIVFAFDRVAAAMKGEATAADIAMGQAMSGYWAAFVRTGDPNGGNRREWLRYDPVSANVLNFTNTGVTFAADPIKARLDLWQSAWEPGRQTMRKDRE